MLPDSLRTSLYVLLLNNLKKTEDMKFSRSLIFLALSWLSLLLFASCAKEEIADNREKEYGYVQFKLYKEASKEGTKALVTALDYLYDATKVKSR